MSRRSEPLLRIVIGVLVAGIIAPFTLWLPEAWQGPPLLYAIGIGCVIAALLLGRRPPP
jgi:hypothetical protein